MKSPHEIKTGQQLVDSPTVTLSISNPAVVATPPTIYSGVAASLNVTVGNMTNADIMVSNQSSLEIFMPGYFTTAQVKAMNISSISLAGWTFSYNAGDVSLMLTYSGPPIKWMTNTALTFTINNMLSAKTSGSDSVQINFSGLLGVNIPASVSATLVLSAQPVVTNANLSDVLLVNTEYGGQIFVSTVADPLTNSLYLDLKNIGATPLYNGTAPWSGNPKVSVSFVYGNTSGALAPGDKQSIGQFGSAWKISGGINVDQTDGWSIENPEDTSGANSPMWTLAPIKTNLQIIGIEEHSNVSFVFNNIFSFTTAGPTQMYVHFTGFRQNEQRAYNDCVFVVPIQKTNPPPTRGIINFFGPPLLYIRQMQNVPVSMEWTGFQIASIKMFCNAMPAPIPTPYVANYPNPVPLVYDGATVTLPDVSPGTDVTFSLASFDGIGRQLNSPQFVVSIVQKPGIYVFSGPGSNAPFTMGQAASCQLNWQVYATARVVITQGSTVLLEKQYPAVPLWQTDSGTVSIGIAGSDSSQSFALSAYDRLGNLLEQTQCNVNFSANAWCDPKDSKVYPIVRVNNQIWLGANYDHDADGSFYYDNNPAFEVPYGRMYHFDAALRNVPDGWRLPMNKDWASLIETLGSNAFNELLPGGSSGLNFLLGGGHYGSSGFDNFGSCVFYCGMPAVYPGYFNALLMEGSYRRLIHADLVYPFPDGWIDAFYIRFILKSNVDRDMEIDTTRPPAEIDRSKILPFLFRPKN